MLLIYHKPWSKLESSFPVYNPVHVKLGLSLLQVLEMNMEKGQLQTIVWTNFAWKDETWKYKEEFIDFQNPI